MLITGSRGVGKTALCTRFSAAAREAGWDVADVGTDSTEAVDYPDFAAAVAERVASGECRWGIMVDGAGIGSAMVANKIPGVKFVPGGHIAVADFQMDGYALIDL